MIRVDNLKLMLSIVELNFLLSYNRAKLLHDAWNLAYAGDLSFATAFNMTLFMKHEREHLVWNPVFTLIDHIGNHIDMSTVHKKFEVRAKFNFRDCNQGKLLRNRHTSVFC